MSVGLMAHIPYNAIFWCVIDIVKGYRNFYNAKTRCQMARVYRQFFDNVFAKFLTHFW